MSVEWACKRWVVHQPTSIWSAQVNIHYFERHISCIKYTEKMDKHAKFVWINWNHLFPFQTRIGNSRLNKVQKCWKPGPSTTLEGLHAPGDWCDHHEGCPSIPAFTHAKRSQSTFKRASNSPSSTFNLPIFKNPSICSSSSYVWSKCMCIYIYEYILYYTIIPIPSMYSISTIFIAHVGKYTMTMDGIYIWKNMEKWHLNAYDYPIYLNKNHRPQRCQNLHPRSLDGFHSLETWVSPTTTLDKMVGQWIGT